MLLVAGGSADINLHLLVERARHRHVAVTPLLVEAGEPHSVSWDLVDDRLTLDRQPLAPTAVFLRYDAFQTTDETDMRAGNRAAGWHALVAGWALSHAVAFPNRHMNAWSSNKPYALVVAERLGIPVAPTVVTTDLERVEAAAERVALVAKPTAGGDYCHAIEQALSKAGRRSGVAAVPAIVQARMTPPEVRVYVIGAEMFCFEMRSSELDYRRDPQCEVAAIDNDEVPAELRRRLVALAAELGMDFAAIDLKTDPDTGELAFLEINSQPMFAAFDREVEGRICDALLRTLGLG